ncbi:helix-turn-helix domain-containing protein [Armatimonas sp.]|uniref:helix-turn-helix domain-containing protein n=1 Tax=Armatimonas sp. TaxID=1872638 RepID=UPI00374CB89A
MPGLDEFYRYIERKEKEADEPASPERPPVPEPGTIENVRYVVRGGITIAVPLDAPDSFLLTVESFAADTAQTTLPLEMLSGKEPTVPRVMVRPTFKIPNPKQATEQLLIPLLPPQHPTTDAEGAELWEGLPRHVQILASMTPDTVPPSRTFEETREQLIIRLLDPILTLEETAKLLDVCPATVRRYANRGNLTHHRTLGQQRRFKLSDVMTFLDKRAAKQQARLL